MNALVKWFAKKWLTKTLNASMSALQTKTDIPTLVANIRRWQDNIKRWYLAVDALLASGLAKAEDGQITDDEVIEMYADGQTFIADITK